MSIRRRIIFWIILGLFIGWTVFHVAWVPYQPADLYRAIPASAMLVSSHQDLAGRWPELATNVIIKAFITPSATSPDQQREFTTSLKIRQWISRLARKETVIAYLPALSPAREPIWIFAGWIGSASQYLRWLLCVQPIAGLDRMANYCAGRPMWRFRQPLTPSGLRLSLAFGEGIFMACLSHNPDAMQHVIMAYEGLAPSIASSAPLHPEIRLYGHRTTNKTRKNGPARLRPPLVKDQGWLRFIQPGKKLSKTLLMSYAIPRFDADYLLAEIQIQPEVKPRSPLSETMDLSVFEQLLGDIPALVAMIPMDITCDLLTQAHTSPGLNIVRRTLQSKALPAPNNNSLVVTLLTGDYSGGLGKAPWRIKVPALMAFMKLRNTNDCPALIAGLLDNLNARYRLGLIIDPAVMSAGKMNVHIMEATLPNILSALAVKDRPAYAVIGPWLVFSSNAQSLIKLLKRYQHLDTMPGTAAGRWQTKLAASKAGAFLWMDMDVCGRVLQLPLTCLRRPAPACAKRSARGARRAGEDRRSASASSSADRDIIKIIKTWLEDVRPLKTGVIWMDSGTSTPVIHLEIGEHPSPPSRPD